ncbi:TPM domain-containing protein [Bdellovibrio sp.]|uniref:TPM domain-containing protein n=1 Tax=Bdellovibrio TaxID=958 RepID=UPI0032219D97
MAWINKYLSENDLAQIEATISRVEESTSGEIVPVIVRRSSAVGHVPLTLTLLLTLLLVIVEFPFSDWLWVTPWVWLWPVLLVVIYGISHVLAKSKWIQKVFVPERDEVDSVHQRAHLEFYLNRIHRTELGTGVLIFVSVMEKKAVVLADEGISKKLPKEHWDEILAVLGKNLHDGKWAAGFVAAIEACGQDLQAHFPVTSGKANELKNHLIVKDV